MKNITEFIVETINSSYKKADSLFFKIDHINYDKDLTYNEIDDLKKQEIYIDGENPYNFIVCTQTGLKNLIYVMQKYLGTKSMREIFDMYPDMESAVQKNYPPIYAVIPEFYLYEKYSNADIKYLEKNGIHTAIAPSKTAEYTVAFFIEDENAFDNILKPWIKKYYNFKNGEEIRILGQTIIFK